MTLREMVALLTAAADTLEQQDDPELTQLVTENISKLEQIAVSHSGCPALAEQVVRLKKTTEEKTMAELTLAQTVAARYDNDGQCWETDDGVQFDCMCRRLGATREWRDGYRVGHVSRWVFPDESVLIDMESCWDHRAPDCTGYCSDGVGCECCQTCDGDGECCNEAGAGYDCPECLERERC
ncbi:MAG: hypothetical protein ACYTEQ_29670 [Planctomycetota bacterium]|jgi:hypothetical protein